METFFCPVHGRHLAIKEEDRPYLEESLRIALAALSRPKVFNAFLDYMGDQGLSEDAIKEIEDNPECWADLWVKHIKESHL